MSDVRIAERPTPTGEMPIASYVLALDVELRGFLLRVHGRRDEVERLEEAMAALRSEAARLGLVDRLLGRNSFEGDLKALFAALCDRAIAAGLTWSDIVATVNNREAAR